MSFTHEEIEEQRRRLPQDEGELVHLTKPVRTIIYFAMAFLLCFYWFVFLWFATSEGS